MISYKSDYSYGFIVFQLHLGVLTLYSFTVYVVTGGNMLARRRLCYRATLDRDCLGGGFHIWVGPDLRFASVKGMIKSQVDTCLFPCFFGSERRDDFAI